MITTLTIMLFGYIVVTFVAFVIVFQKIDKLIERLDILTNRTGTNYTRLGT